MFSQADVIYAYTRLEAIEDGVLIEITPEPIKWAISICATAAFFTEVIEKIHESQREHWILSNLFPQKQEKWHVSQMMESLRGTLTNCYTFMMIGED